MHRGVVSEYNHDRDREISRANRLIRDAKSDIRRAEDDIDDAEDLIDDAERDIRRAEGQISDARHILRNLPGYQATISSTVEANFSTQVEDLKSDLTSMKRRSHISQLDSNLSRQQRLISNMETRPARPDGWVIPDRLVQ